MDLKNYLEKGGLSQREFAEKLGVTQGAVSQWLNGRVPAERVREIVAATGGEVTVHELRPDVFGVLPKKHRREQRHA